MSTRSNIILVTPDNKAHQFYHHCDGYLSGVGEELRKHLVYSIGMNTIIKDVSLYDILVGELASDNEYEDEYKFDLNAHNKIHADIEFTYVIRGNDLYFVYEWDLCHKVATYKDLVNYVCKDVNKLALDKPLHDDDE
jgi:hypothetical protein